MTSNLLLVYSSHSVVSGEVLGHNNLIGRDPRDSEPQWNGWMHVDILLVFVYETGVYAL